MIWLIIRATVRERLTTSVRTVAVLVLLFCTTFLAFAVGESFRSSMSVSITFDTFLVWLLGSGVIGEEAASGVLLLVFSRPLLRSTYVLGKWLGLSLIASATFFVELSLLTVATVQQQGWIALDFGVLALALSNRLAVAFGASAVLVLFSTLIRGNREILIAFVLWVVTITIEGYGALRALPWAGEIYRTALHVMFPRIDFVALAGGTSGWQPVALYLFVVSAALTGAVAIMNRKELSYSVS